MNIWIDDVRPAPRGWLWVKTTANAIEYIETYYSIIEGISLDHDAGDFNDISFGGDYIHVLDWAEFKYGRDFNIPIHLHSANPVGVQNMRRIIEHNGWREVY